MYMVALLEANYSRYNSTTMQNSFDPPSYIFVTFLKIIYANFKYLYIKFVLVTGVILSKNQIIISNLIQGITYQVTL